jgi:hypothetical protein
MPWPISHFPARERIHELVSDIERAKADELISEYRASEESARLNDLHAFGETIARCEREGTFVEAQAARQGRDKADHEKFLKAQDNLRQLRERASDQILPILARLLDTFTEELDAAAIEREASLMQLGIPLFVEVPSANLVIRPGHEPQFTRSWKLPQEEEIKARFCFREVTRHLLTMFRDGTGRVTAGEVRQARGVVTLQFLATDEPVTFSWT